MAMDCYPKYTSSGTLYKDGILAAPSKKRTKNKNLFLEVLARAVRVAAGKNTFMRFDGTTTLTQ